MCVRLVFTLVKLHRYKVNYMELVLYVPNDPRQALLTIRSSIYCTCHQGKALKKSIAGDDNSKCLGRQPYLQIIIIIIHDG